MAKDRWNKAHGSLEVRRRNTHVWGLGLRALSLACRGFMIRLGGGGGGGQLKT